MPILVFENYETSDLELTVEPWGDRHLVPHLAEAGIRYTLSDGAEDRSYSSVSNGRIELWLNADRYEIEIVPPTPFGRLMWDICVNGGWCGGIVDGKLTTVDMLLPKSGTVTAGAFAELVDEAECGPMPEPPNPDLLRWLEGRFVEHLGADEVGVEQLQRMRPGPFDQD